MISHKERVEQVAASHSGDLSPFFPKILDQNPETGNTYLTYTARGRIVVQISWDLTNLFGKTMTTL